MARVTRQIETKLLKKPANRISAKRPGADTPVAREALNMRIHPDIRDLIDRAANLTGKTRTDFVLDAARQAAQGALLDQTRISMSSEDYTAFLKLLDAPIAPSARLRKSLLVPAVWE